jgi:quercetin dioxygenase-like cupin family protein
MSGTKPVSAGPVMLKELVAYQNGAVVSRTIVDTVAGTVTAFAFDENQGLSEHTAAYDALVLVIEGKVSIRISGKDFYLEEGQAITMPANQPHAVKAVTRFKMLLVMIRAK